MAQSKKSPVKAAAKTSSSRKPDKAAPAKKPAAKVTAAKAPPKKTAAVASKPAKTAKSAAQPKAKAAAVAVKAPTKAAAATVSKVKVKPEVTASTKKQVAAPAPATSKANPVTAPKAPAAVKPAVAAIAALKKPVAKAPAAAVVAAAAGKPAAAPAARAIPAAVHKPAERMMTAPSMPVLPAQPTMPRAANPKELALKAAEARRQQMLAPKKPVNSRHGFKIGESIVYPAHGVGQIIGIEEQEIAGMTLELFVIQIEKDKLTLRVPTARLEAAGIRKLAEDNIVSRAMETLKGRARIKRTMWSRRAQEYEAKINSGDLIAIAEVVRDLYRSDTQPEQSYSERQLYESALDRMAREIAVVDKLDERTAMQRITEVLSRSARGRRATDEPAGDTQAA